VLAEPDLIDETIHYSGMQIWPRKDLRFRGQSARHSSQDVAPRHKTGVFLVEAVEYQAVKGALDGLPKAQAGEARQASQEPGRAPASRGSRGSWPLTCREAPRQANSSDLHPIEKAAQTSKVRRPGEGLILDYSVSLTAGTQTLSWMRAAPTPSSGR